MTQPLVSCLLATSGRYADNCMALAMFLSQDYENKELLIWNNSDVPLLGDFPQVRIINKGGLPTLGHVRQAMLAEAKGEFFRSWDTDDLFLPWTVSQGVENIGHANAFKPEKSFWFDGNGHGSGVKREPCFELCQNALEASVTWRTEFAKTVGFRLGQGDEHAPLLEALGDNMKTANFDWWPSYVYMWQAKPNAFQASMTLQGNNYTNEQRASDWKTRNSDHRPGVPLVPDYKSVREWFIRLSRIIPFELRTQWLMAALGEGKPYTEPLKVKPKKIVPAEQADAWMGSHRQVVALPGCWDGCHPGQIATINWARQEGQRLASQKQDDPCRSYVCVLVNDDAGVAAQKGKNRPMLSLEARCAALSAVDGVDLVIPFAGVDDLPTLNTIKADYVVKGHEYALKHVPKPEGCKVLIAPDSGHKKHTSDLFTEPTVQEQQEVKVATEIESCNHTEFQGSVQIERNEQGNRFIAKLAVKCLDCGSLMRFIGLPVGLDAAGAAVSETGQEVRLAMRPSKRQ